MDDWDTFTLDPLPVMDLPEYEPLDLPDYEPIDLSTDMSLDALAERYSPEQTLASTDKGRRPPRWNDPQILTLLGHLETGLHLTAAIAAAGLSERTVYRWMEKGRTEADADPEGTSTPTVYRHIWHSIMRAEGVPEAIALDVIQRAAARGGWRAAAWFLERRYPDRWGRNGTAWQREQEAKDTYVSVEEVDAKLMRLIGESRSRDE